MSAAQAQKAADYLEKAHKKKGSISLFGGSTKYEEAAEYFTKAANLFKVLKKWQEAGDAFSQSAELQLQKLQSKHEAATDYVSAATCYKKCNTEDAVNCLKMAIEIYVDTGRFSSAAKYQKEIGEIFENENQLELAVENFQQAADYYGGEDALSAANQCLLKVANFSATLEKYDRAIEIFEQVASASLDNPLLKWSVKEYYLRAGLCHLCLGDVVTTQNALKRYCEMDATFSSQREYTFLEEVCKAVEEADVDTFTNVVYEFDSMSKLDAWKTTTLLRIKNGLKADIL